MGRKVGAAVPFLGELGPHRHYIMFCTLLFILDFFAVLWHAFYHVTINEYDDDDDDDLTQCDRGRWPTTMPSFILIAFGHNTPTLQTG